MATNTRVLLTLSESSQSSESLAMLEILLEGSDVIVGRKGTSDSITNRVTQANIELVHVGQK